MNRRRKRTVQSRVRKEKGERVEINRVKKENKEVVMATWDVRTLAVKGKNGMGHAETLLLRAQTLGCDIIGLPEVRRGEQGSFKTAGCTVNFSGLDWPCRSASWRQAGPILRDPSMNVSSKCS